MSKVTESNPSYPLQHSRIFSLVLSGSFFLLFSIFNGVELLTLFCLSEQNNNKRDGGGEKKTASITVVLKVDMHCDGCASKLVKSVRAFQGLILYEQIERYRPLPFYSEPILVSFKNPYLN